MASIIFKSEKADTNSSWIITNRYDRTNFTSEESVIIDKYYEFVESLVGFESIDTVIDGNTKTTTIKFNNLDNADLAFQLLSNTPSRAIESTNSHNLLQSKSIELGIINKPSMPKVQE
jgi:hypothetical protein